MYTVPLQCFSTVTCGHVTALTVMAAGTRTLQDTHRHSLPRLQHNASWLPEAVCHCSTERRRPSRANRYKTVFPTFHLSHVHRCFIIRCMSVWGLTRRCGMYLYTTKRKCLSEECWPCSPYRPHTFSLLILNCILLLSDRGRVQIQLHSRKVLKVFSTSVWWHDAGNSGTEWGKTSVYRLNTKQIFSFLHVFICPRHPIVLTVHSLPLFVWHLNIWLISKLVYIWQNKKKIDKEFTC